MDFEQRLQEVYERILRPGDVCIDVGAHAGRHAFPMARRVSPGGHVYAFEPVPNMFEHLRAAIVAAEETGCITLFPFAASDRDGVSEFVVAVDNPAYSGLKERVYDTPTRLERITVETCTLDRVLSDIGSARYLKIDVEGGEWGVIRGASRLIERFRPVVSFEFGEASYRKYGVNPEEVHAFFADRDFAVVDILGHRLDRDQFVVSCRDQHVWDYIAIPADGRELERACWAGLHGA